MKQMAIFLSLSLLAAVAQAGPKCTDADQKTWMNKETFKKDRIAEGFKIKKFKITSGNCYEIYGWDKDSKKVEIYYNPITAKIVKKRDF